MKPTNLQRQLALFKALTLISTLLLTGAVIFIFTRESATYFEDSQGNKLKITQPMLNELYEMNNVMSISDPELIDTWEQLNVNIDSGKTGRKIRLKDAISKRDSFNTWNKKKFNFVKEITPFGFAFGKQRIRTMLREIDSTNRELNKLKKTDSLIHGVRAYLSFSRNNNGKKSRHLDLIFVPIMKNGNTFYNLKKYTHKALGAARQNDPMLLNTSSPCPKMCEE